MSTIIETPAYSPELLDSIVEDIEGQASKDAVREIIQSFDAEGFTIKIQRACI